MILIRLPRLHRANPSAFLDKYCYKEQVDTKIAIKILKPNKSIELVEFILICAKLMKYGLQWYNCFRRY